MGMWGFADSVAVQAVNPSDTNQGEPTSATSPQIKRLSAFADDDGDGMSNAAEDLAGINPLDSVSQFRITEMNRIDATHVTVTWTSARGKMYRVEATMDLATPFTPVSGTVASAGPSTSVADAAATSTPRFYRVSVVP